MPLQFTSPSSSASRYNETQTEPEPVVAAGADGKIKQCPHCGQTFVCRNESILDCDCVSIRLTQEARRRIRERYEDCLCVDCLRSFAREGK